MYKLNIHLSAIIAAFTLAFQISPAAVLNVPDDYETIQEGIDHAEDGDTVLVQPGFLREIRLNNVG